MIFQVENTRVFLIPSMHLLPEEWRGLRPHIWRAYRQSAVCIFEENAFAPRFPFPPMMKDADTYFPWAQALIRSSELAGAIGLSADCGLDAQLLTKALEDGINIEYLDTENACNALARAPLAEQEDMLAMVLDKPDELQALLKNIYLSWLTWDVTALTSLLESQCRLFPETYHHLVTRRNLVWSNRIFQIIDSGVPAIITVGALHFVGCHGICRQADLRGHTLLEIGAVGH
jgi:uncharacterized protein YbaP (TraB family)